MLGQQAPDKWPPRNTQIWEMLAKFPIADVSRFNWFLSHQDLVLVLELGLKWDKAKSRHPHIIWLATHTVRKQTEPRMGRQLDRQKYTQSHHSKGIRQWVIEEQYSIVMGLGQTNHIEKSNPFWKHVNFYTFTEIESRSLCLSAWYLIQTLLWEESLKWVK